MSNDKITEDTTQNQVTEPNLIIKPNIRISVRTLVEFILRSGDIDSRHKGSIDNVSAMLEGSRIHRLIQRRMGPEYHAEVYLRHTIDSGDYDIIIEGRADGIIYSDNKANELTVIDEIKTTYTNLEFLKKPSELHLAQAKCYAYIFALQQNLKEIGVRMTYFNVETQEIKYFHENYTFFEIKSWFDMLLDKYARWAEFEFHWKINRNNSIHALSFPFEYREGQKELITQVYHTLYHKKRLFIEAPTGVGKTISTVFPSVKAMGEGMCDKLFYLTAKTITRTVASNCFDILRSKGLEYKSVILTAKEKICIMDKPECNPDACTRARGHFDRINDAMYDLLMNEDSFDREKIEAYAEKHKVCPFEMSLDMSIFSDAIICDYNYVFDPNAYLRRFFGEGNSGEYIFLIDEAHNLVDRGMDMYSAVLFKESFMEIKRLIKQHDKKLERALENCNKQFLALKRECEDFKVEESLSPLVVSLTRAMGLMEKFLDEKDRFEYREQVTDLYLELRHFLNMYENMGENDYAMYSQHVSDGRFFVKLLCTNPSASLRQFMDKSRSTILFSATLLPIDYFMDMLSGDRNDYTVYAKSIFDNRKRGLYIAGDVSSKYTRRNLTEYMRIAEYIDKITCVRKGNYIAFFPSYTFMKSVIDCYEKYYVTGDIDCIVQGTSMSENDREEFLLHFERTASDRSLLAFCVLGGVFSEGIDLTNDKLIGAMIVGTGLPLVCNERELLKQTYIDASYDGFDYAYKYPGMNKVMQAAGRVIRTVDDIGVVILLDDRFNSMQYKRIFPREWKNYETVNINNVEDKIEEFWELSGNQD